MRAGGGTGEGTWSWMAEFLAFNDVVVDAFAFVPACGGAGVGSIAAVDAAGVFVFTAPAARFCDAWEESISSFYLPRRTLRKLKGG